jgi:hypothetical protein
MNIAEKNEEYDLDVLRCFMSGEMGRMFGVARKYKKTTKEIIERYDEIKSDKEYYSYLRPIAKELEGK